MERYGLRLGVGWGCCSPGAAKPWGFVVLLLWVRPLDGLLWDFGDESSTLHPMEGKVSKACRSQCPHVCRGVLEGHAGGCSPPLLMPWHLVALSARLDCPEIQRERQSCDGCGHPWGCGCPAGGRDGV